MIDTAVDYGSQPGIGEALASTEVERNEIYLVAKVEEDEDAFDASRRYLDVMKQDYADLVLIHRPPENGVGVELWKGLIRARSHGMTRDIGVSTYFSSRRCGPSIDSLASYDPPVGRLTAREAVNRPHAPRRSDRAVD